MKRRPLARIVLTAWLLVLIALATMPAGSAGARQDDGQKSPEQTLAEQFAPIVVIKKQQVDCSTDGEQFRPVSVDILFGTDDVRLMKRGDGDKSTDTEVKRNIQASDLYQLDDQYYLDLPFEPRDPGCDYEKWGEQRMAELDMPSSLYARIATEDGSGKLVLQYWYYWIFNLFNNTHESDWEGIQLTFEADSVQHILDQGLLPQSIEFAQHDSGEQQSWTSQTVELRDTHVISYPSSGSHADYFSPGVWLGWGENGSGFGCDYAEPPHEELPVDIILMPDDFDDPDSDFAWLTFDGRWGERDDFEVFSGPTGPNLKLRWLKPVSWGDNARAISLQVPVRPTIGPEISRVFCGVAELGSTIVRMYPIDPRLATATGIGLLLGLVVLMVLARRPFARAVRLYVTHGYFFITVGLVAFPIAWVGQLVENQVENRIFAGLDPLWTRAQVSRDIYQFVLHSGLGGIQEVLLTCLIGPVVILGTLALLQGHPPGLDRTWKRGARFFPRMLSANFYVTILLSLMTLTVVLAPVAIYKGVQWFFVPQAVVADDDTWRHARHTSAKHVSGRWIRAFSVVIVIQLLMGLVGPVIGSLLMVLHVVDLDRAQWISALIYCVVYPLALIMSTLFYLQPTEVKTPAPAKGAAGSPAPAPDPSPA